MGEGPHRGRLVPLLAVVHMNLNDWSQQFVIQISITCGWRMSKEMSQQLRKQKRTVVHHYQPPKSEPTQLTYILIRPACPSGGVEKLALFVPEPF
jgi:hypothetical protein